LAQNLSKLSALAVAKVSKPGYYGDGGGLVLQVSATGSKSWLFRFNVAGRRREMGLGSLNAVSLSEARIKARECRSQLQLGQDPLEARDALRKDARVQASRVLTFAQCAKAYINAHHASWKNAKHGDQWTNTLATYAGPVIGDIPVAAVDTDLIVKVLMPIWDTKTETATRLRGRIESVLDWATVSKFRAGDNPARWRGHLENLLANPNKIAPVKNHPALPWQEIGAFLSLLEHREGVAARAVRFTILSACRSGEIRGATWDEFDLKAKIWTIPAKRMKAGKEHRVPLSEAALAILQPSPADAGLVFPGRKNAQLSDMSLTAVLRRMGRSDITVHGFRSTFRDWCAEAVGNSFSREVCEHALAHSLPDKVEAAYRRGDLLTKRVELMNAWAEYCTSDKAATARHC
jgi:integrase